MIKFGGFDLRQIYYEFFKEKNRSHIRYSI